MTKHEGRMGIIVSRRRRRGMAQPSRPDPLPQSQPENQEPSTATQEDVLRSNDDGNESDPDEKSDVSDERDSESRTNDEGSHESEPDEHNQSKSSQSVNSNESAKDVLDTAGASETITTEDTTEVDEFNNDWKKVFLEDLDIKISDNVKIVRIFTSSTFTDTFVERNTLMERVYPRLKSFCQERGYDFQVVDMRWGVRDESTDDHMTTELCMKELRACQKLSTGPNFITFLGQKYGYRPFPVKVSAAEFEKLLRAVNNPDDLELLKNWFWRDDNGVPAQYLLQPITSLLPHYRDYASEELRKKASGDWWTAFERMQVVLRTAADAALEEGDRHKYYMSVTEDEIRRGIITAIAPEKHCFWFKRVITDLIQNVDNRNAGKFLDKTYGNDSAVDESARKLLSSLREKELPAVLSTKNVVQYNVQWTSEGINPDASVEHAQYLETLCTDVYNVLTDMIQGAIKEKEASEKEDSVVEEILQHALFCQKKGLACKGRDEFLQSVKQSLLDYRNKRVVILHGESGCGKTSVMAKIAVEIKKWLEDESVIVVLRFIGTSPESSSVRLLLRSVCQQLYKVTENDSAEIPEDLMELLEFFPKCLEDACSFRPVVLMLDSLDQLPADEGGRRLDWLPAKIPDDFYLIMSTLPGEEYECLPHLKTVFPDRCFKEIPTIPANEADVILESWLSSANRTLVPAQKAMVLKAFEECPLPLYLKLSFDQACRWKSYTPANETVLPAGVKNVVSEFFDQVERRHGKILVSHALGYITASKNGLTEPELEDILSLDDEVLDDVYQYWTPPFRRLPPLLWIRIRSEIGDYLIERGADDTQVIYWYHRQFIEVATDRYLKAQPEVHSKLADYFLGKWSNGAEKPYVEKDGQTVVKDRLVANQPLTFRNESEKREVFNLRKLNELPHHLLHAGDLQRLKEETLCNFEFLLAKLRATSLESVLDDFVVSLLVYPEDEDLIELEKTLQLSSVALKSDANQLAPQLLGRLTSLYGKDEFSGISVLLQQAYSSSVPCLIPSDKCLTSPGGSLISSMKIPGESVYQCCGFSCDGKTAYVTSTFSQPLHIQILTINLQNGKTIRRVTLPGSLEVGTVWTVQGSQLKDDLLLLVGSTDIFLINTSTGQIFQRFTALVQESYNPMPPVSFADNETRIVAITDEDLKIWNAEDGQLIHKIDIGKIPTDEEYGTIGAVGHRAAFSVHGTKSFTVLNTRTGERVRQVNVFNKEDACCIEEIKVTFKEQVVVTSSERNNLRLYDLHTGDLVREVPQFKINKGLLRLRVTTDGKKAVGVADYEILVTNLEDGTVHKTLKSKSFGTLIIHVNFYTRDGKFAISVAHDNIIRLYDLEQAVKENTEEVSTVSSSHKAVSSVDSINYLGRETDYMHRHVIATAMVDNASQILIWDALTGKKVRVLKLTQEMPPTAIKMHGAARAVGFIHDQEFFHLKVFDLKTGKVARYLQGKASKRTEAFGFVDEDNIIAFSRGRRNLKVWNLDDGNLVKQYKFGQTHRFEDMLISRNGRSVVCSQVSQIVNHDEETLPLIFLNTQTGDHKFLEIESTQLLLWNGSITDDGSYLVCLTKDFKALLWDLTNGSLKHRLVADEESPTVTSTAISSVSSIVLTGAGDGGISVWDIVSGRLRYAFKCETVDSLFMTQDGQLAFCNYRYRNSSIDAWDLSTGVRLASFTSDWKPERMTISGNCLVVAKADKPEFMTLRPHIPGRVETVQPNNSPFENCPLESNLQPAQGLASAREKDEDEDADDDSDVTDVQRTEFTKKAVHAKPNVIIGGGSTVFASKNVFISEKVYRDNFM